MNYFALFTLNACLSSIHVYATDTDRPEVPTLVFDDELTDVPRKRSIYTRHKRKPTPYVEDDFLPQQDGEPKPEDNKKGLRHWIKRLLLGNR
jgi:hypothetical protein